MTKSIPIKTMLMALALVAFSLNANAADPLSAIAALDNALHATSLATMLAKVSGNDTGLKNVKTVPRLKVESDCGDCQLSNATRMLMISAYTELAKANDITINQNEQLIFKVTSLFSRNSFLRGTLGALSGADLIKGHFENETTIISEYSISHEMGIDEITQQLGEDLLKATVAVNIKQLKATP